MIEEKKKKSVLFNYLVGTSLGSYHHTTPQSRAQHSTGPLSGTRIVEEGLLENRKIEKSKNRKIGKSRF
jgi:hypothetical protein